MSLSVAKRTTVNLDHFYQWSHHLYKDAPLEDYLSDFSTQSADDCVNSNAEFFNDKRGLPSVLPEGFCIRTLGVFTDGAYEGDLEVLTNPVVVKPASGSQGMGVAGFSSGLDRGSFLTYMRDSEEESVDYIVTEMCEQGEYARAIWPHSANGLRILTFWHEGEMHAAAAVHKWGTFFSGFKDNWSLGGITTWVEDGVLKGTREDFSPMDGREGGGSKRIPVLFDKKDWLVHPERGTKIEGVELPYWQETLGMLATAHDLLRPGLLYCGWDVMITDSGPKIIEANPWPGVQLIQVHRPLLQNEVFKDFLLSRGVEGIN